MGIKYLRLDTFGMEIMMPCISIGKAEVNPGYYHFKAVYFLGVKQIFQSLRGTQTLCNADRQAITKINAQRSRAQVKRRVLL